MEAVAAVQDKHTSASIKKRPGRTEVGEGFPREMKSSGNEDVAGSEWNISSNTGTAGA